MQEHTSTWPGTSQKSPVRWRWISSLGFLAALSSGIAWMVNGALWQPEVQPPGPETVISTQIGQHESRKLADGTQLVLNTESRVRSDPKSHRIVLERGEVIADVRSSSVRDCPVVFDIGELDFEADATTQLRIRKDQHGVVLLDVLAGRGVLRSMSARQMIELIAGQTALIQPGDVVVVTEFEPSQLQRALSWQDGEVWLKGETLQEAIDEFNRYNVQKLVVLDKDLAGRRVGGRFETTDVEGFVDALQHLFGVRVLAVRPGGRGASTLVLLPSDREA